MDLLDLCYISILISLTAIFISLMPFLIDLYEDFHLPDWRIFMTAEEREVLEKKEKEKRILEELIKKYNVPTNIQKDLGAVTDKYFLIDKSYYFADWRDYWIFIRQPDGALGEKKGVLTFSVEGLRAFPLTSYESDELNKMCDEEVQDYPLKIRRRVMQDRFCR